MGESYNGARLSRGDFTMPGSEVGRIIRFGVFEIDLQSGELRRDGLKVRLQEQPFQILAMLIERPGEMVTREDLCRKLWPADTFVDFDHSLNAAVKRLRDALGESAETPIFIETLARRGYRFIAPVNGAGVESDAVASAVVPTPAVAQTPPAVGGGRLWLIAIAVCAVAIVAWGWRQWRHQTTPPAATAIRSLAVLPLENLGRDPSQEYLADAMTEELIGRLSKIRSLRVISRTSTMHFKHTQLSAPEIAKTLVVGNLRSPTRGRICARECDSTIHRFKSRGFGHLGGARQAGRRAACLAGSL